LAGDHRPDLGRGRLCHQGTENARHPAAAVTGPKITREIMVRKAAAAMVATGNVIATAAGIGEGLGVGDNTRAAVMARGLAELTRLGVAMGAQPDDPCGAGGDGGLDRHLH